MQESLEAAKNLLPFVIRWGSTLYIVVAFLASRLIMSAGIWVAAPRLPPMSSPWYERARVVFGIRCTFRLGRIFLSLSAWFGTLLIDSTFSEVSPSALRLCSVVAALLGVELAGMRSERRLGIAGDSLPKRFANAVTFGIVMALHFIVVLAATALWAKYHSWFVVLALSPVFVWGALGGGVQLAQMLRMARRGGARVTTLVSRLTAETKLAPTLYELPFSVANAFAFPVIRSIAVTRGALETLSDDELEAVLAHELAHLSEPTKVLLVRAATPLLLGIALFAIPLVWGLGLAVVTGVMAAALCIVVATRRIARAMEVQADAHAAATNSVGYAQALLRLYETNLVPAVRSSFSVHPSLYDRVTAAGVRPDFPRPRPPNPKWVIFGYLTIATGAFAIFFAHVALCQQSPGYSLATSPSEAAYSNYALQHFRAGDRTRAAALYSACAAVYSGIACPRNLALVELGLRHCQEAHHAIEQARQRINNHTSPNVLASFRDADIAVAMCRN